ncbi:Hsp70 protein-domain-containing protein [Pyronema domesticum]|uniref:Similar to Ribosome-associated complex subunit SSZ1 acc. no. P38788 n=1 Tax=Pyronema omphalodes (strain CBS 100304) TaxID=1076935 RepID=U4KV08_PYROM|nr:Hsp70 protein-domain-containing protein [Pyronema domesticum]CCX04972.1 Similar to Ribosome-associated complex subunit SSZ1; acc. no. P38788 [Pyronema omphalodes CBS 100304]
MSDTQEVESGVVIGIAFGNTTSSIAYTSADGKPELIANEEGDRQIPSVLSYLDSDEFHGGEAKAQLVRNHGNTVAYFRDFLGKKFSEIDPTNAHNSAHPIDAEGKVSFSVVEKAGKPAVNITVEEITARHLRRLVSSAADFLGKPVTKAIVTVPTDFTEAQRAALTSAALDANIQILQVIQEPVAEALAYAARDNFQTADKVILVADIGGTRTDATVVAVRGGMYTILATAHDYELGGVRLDATLVDHFAKEFIKKHKSDPRENQRSLAKLKLECEVVKRTLSIATSASIGIDSLCDGYDFHSTINRFRYETIGRPLFDQIIKLAENVVSKAEIDLLDIDEVILAGGSSHTPKIAQRFESLFPNCTIHAPATETTALNPSELAARGAAIQASLVSEFDVEDIDQSTHPMVTVAPHLSKDIGVVIVAADGTETFQTLLPAQTAMPARRAAEFNAPAEGGDVVIKFVEGGSVIKKEIIPPAPKDEDDSDDEEDEPEEVKSKEMKVEKLLAEALLKGTEKGQKIEVTVQALEAGELNVTARIVGTQNGVRGQVKA